MGDISAEKKSSCGLLTAVFGRRSIWPRRTTSTGSLPVSNNANSNNLVRVPSTPNSKRRRGASDEASLHNNPTEKQQQKQQEQQQVPKIPLDQKPIPKPVQSHPRNPPKQNQRVPNGTLGISGELESMIADHQRSKGASNLVRASSSNVMLYGNLGNLRQPGGNNGNNMNSTNVLDYLPRTAKEESSGTQNGGKYPTSGMGNLVKKPNHQDVSEKPTSLCRAISTRMDPETLKIMGNEDYKNGRFAEALALYDAAISIDPDKASYRSNKSAALTALGRVLEAVFECREAIRIEPFYQRAHNRLATLYLRLGEVEKVAYHYKHAGVEADPELLPKAKNLQVHLNRCTEAKRLRDWNTLLKETGVAISAGADSAPQIFALQAETLLKLHRYQEADEAWMRGPKFDVDDCTKFFGPISNANLLMIRAQVDMAAGRFDDAIAAAQHAARLDSNNKEVNMVVRRTRVVGSARSKGNELFKTSRYSEACVAYGEGLDHDPYNSVLLCNRAACRSKLGQFEKAIEDCNAALNSRPSYSKARLRRADCNAKLEKWEACVQDYEILIRETPGDEEVDRALKEAQVQLGKQKGQHVRTMKVDGGAGHDVVVISSNERFRNYVSSPGMSVVLFCNKPGNNQTLHFMDLLHKRYSSINFLKVEVEDHPSIQKSEGVSSLPAFKIYKSGSRPKEIPGDNHDLLESSIKFYTAT